MPHIQQLAPHIADLIAAGEVVERPASVVKELVENAIDAGAHCVTVEIQHGGMALIRVTDDGCGIAPDEAATAFLRHATSKIRTEYDLEAIATLGFRGEALAAIASVARVQLLTRRQADALGTAVTLEGGQVVSQEEAGCPAGTTMVVRDLFFNTPARLKFMKKDAAEGAACLAAVQRQALAHPEVSFKCIRDSKQELLTPGDGQLRSALYAVLGRDLALGFVPVEGSGEDITVRGFVSRPTCCRGSRSCQFFFVNGRYVKSASLTAAVEQAYANQKMVGKFPGCALHITLKPNAVDVNVHPTKQEVKFGAERQVFSAVYHAVLSALGGDSVRPSAAVPPQPKPVTAGPVRLSQPAPPPPPVARPGYGKAAQKETFAQTTLPLHDFTAPKRDVPAAPPVAARPPVTPPTPAPAAPEPPAAVPVADAPAPQRETPPAEPEPWRIAGELFHTYIVVEQGDKALLIDKHAAHERMNFDRLRAQDYTPMSQYLLSPVVFTPTPDEHAVLLENVEALDKVGFEVEDFGGGSLVVRRAPDFVEAGEVEATLTDIAAKLTLTGSTGYQDRRDAVLHTVACKAAIKGGWTSAREELEVIAQAVVSGQVKYCPHGRPVAIELTRQELEKQFKRRT